MSCEDNVCGTGLEGSNNPKPGDPDNVVSIAAATVYGGIAVSWSFPTTNPHAVAYTVLYRGTSDNWAQAQELAKVGGSIYRDQMEVETNTRFWYWIRIRTTNGTFMDPVGPATAVAVPVGPQTLETLTDLIDNGVLAKALKEQIAGISLQGQQLLQEIQDRISDNEALSAAIALVNSGVEQALTFVQQEITQRTEGDSAIVVMLNNIAAIAQDNLAAILQEAQVRADADSAMASQITTLFSQTAANQAAIQNEAQVRTDADSAFAQQQALLTTRVDQNQATILQEQTTRASADEVLAQQINQTEVTLNGNIATVQTNLNSTINTVNGKVTEIGALYTAKVQVNGLIGGFGVYNDGTLVEAGFDVDRFWIGRTGPDKVKPFIIDNGIVYIDKARIREADIDTLKIAGNAITMMLSASNVVTGTPTNATCNITVVTHGAPVFLTACGMGTYDASGSSMNAMLDVFIYRDGNLLKVAGNSGMAPSGSGNATLSTTPVHIDHPPEGTHTYTFMVQPKGSVSAETTAPFQLEINAALLETRR